jgi:hypothetical protein
MRTRGAWIAAGLFSVIVAAAVYVPIAPQPLEQEPDLSFRITTHDAFARHLQMGRDIVSTYGPWGILARGSDRRTDGIVLSVSAFLAAVFAWSVISIARDAGASPWVVAIAMLATGSILAAGAFDARFTAIALLLILSTLEPPSNARELPLVGALALIALIKFSYLALTVFLLLIVAIIRRRISPVLVFAVAFLVAWLAAGQRLSSLPLFLKWGAEVARGYGGASAGGSGVPTAILGAIALLIFVGAIERNLSRTILVCGGIAYLMKVGYVRADVAHSGAANALLLFLATGYLLVRREALASTRRAMLVAALVGVAMAIVVGVPVLADQMREEWLSIREWSSRGAMLDREIASRSGAESVPQVDGTIDAYPWGSVALIVRKMRYTPRPVFQSCMAWTGALADLNATFLRTHAPDWLWTSVGSIDDRLPLLDDAPSWLEILRRYEIAAPADDHLLLRKSVTARPLALAPIASPIGRFNQDLAVPDAPLVWCAIDLHPTVLTRIEEIVARPPIIYVEIVTADGKRAGYRAPVALLGGGFLVSPHVTSIVDLAALMRDQSGRRATAIRVIGRGYREPFTLHFSAVRMPVRASETLRVRASPRTSLPR